MQKKMSSIDITHFWASNDSVTYKNSYICVLYRKKAWRHVNFSYTKRTWEAKGGSSSYRAENSQQQL